MNWLGFGFFLIITLVYIWNGVDAFGRKQWLRFVLNIFAVFIGTFLFSLALKGVLKLWPFITLPQAKSLMLILSTSFLVVLMMKFFVVMLCAIFSWIMGFHRSHNTEHYPKLASIAQKFSPGLVLLVKALASVGSALIFYGIWLARP